MITADRLIKVGLFAGYTLVVIGLAGMVADAWAQQPRPAPTYTDEPPAVCDGKSTVWGCRPVTVNGLPCLEKWCIASDNPIGTDPDGPRAIYCPKDAT